MTKKLLAIFAATVGLFMLAVPVSAHHGKSNFDMTHTFTVKGTVTEYEWTNPHVLIHFDVTGEDGKVEHWVVYANSPNVLSRTGWSKNTFKPGDQLTLTGHRIKSGTNFMDLRKIITADGRELHNEAEVN